MAYHFLFEYVTQTTKECYESSGVSSLNLLWEELTKAWITLPLCLCCHPQEKWARRKSPWQLCVLKRQTARSQCHFIGCYFAPCCREKRLWNHVALNVLVNQSGDEWRDIYRKTAQSSQGNLCPESEPRGIQLILLVWKVEALLHSLRTWTWTFNLHLHVRFIYNELLCVRAHGRGLERVLVWIIPAEIWAMFLVWTCNDKETENNYFTLSSTPETYTSDSSISFTCAF